MTVMPVLTMPAGDVTHPVPDLTGYITVGQIVLSADAHARGTYPARRSALLPIPSDAPRRRARPNPRRPPGRELTMLPAALLDTHLNPSGEGDHG